MIGECLVRLAANSYAISGATVPGPAIRNPTEPCSLVPVLDEMDAGDANLFTYANKSIANESYTSEVRFENPVVKKHKGFVIMGACNTYGSGADAMYVGRNQLDAATLDRFKVGMITMDYSRDVEASLASDELCQWAWAIREEAEPRLKRIMSTRVIKDLSTMTKMYGWGRGSGTLRISRDGLKPERKLSPGGEEGRSAL